jgi:L-lactate dehydrogenase complex protein LldG
MNGRNKILDRLKSVSIQKFPPPERQGDTEIFLDHPGTSSLLELFQQQLTSLSGEIHTALNLEQAAEKLYDVVKEFPLHSCLVQPSEFAEEIISRKNEINTRLDRTFKLNSNSVTYSRFHAGITTAESMVARTGSILLTSEPAGRRLSVLPPLHIVLAREEQIVPSLEDAYSLLAKKSMDWSYAVLITGPSRTSDIEKQLVLGAHGPKRLVVIIVRS